MIKDFSVGGFDLHSFDIDADGAYLYVSAKNDSNEPVVLRLPATLDADPLESYDPGAGTAVNVICGDYTSYFVWAFGDFGGLSRVVLSEDGQYWYQQNPAIFETYWYGAAGPAVMGPANDNQLMLCINEDDFALHESYFVGDVIYWLTEPGLPFPVGAIDRNKINEDEILIGVRDKAYWYSELEQMYYSPARGEVWADISYGLFGVSVTTIIFG